MLANANVSMVGSTDNLPPTVLVVEDEELIRLFLTEFLQDFGYRVIEAANVAEAKDQLVHNEVDVVFSDINMPGSETGFALEKWMRRHYPNTKVILTSGYPQAAADTKDLVEPLILKPYAVSTVVRRIESVLSRRGRQPLSTSDMAAA
jgi:DNA-binding NtrC family response regulator